MDLMTYLLAQKGGGGGGSDLPVVTPADNGKILGVVSGAWSTVNPGTVIDLPMTLQVGTQESPVYLSELDEGLYAINGKYYILRNSEPFETDYNIIALVSKEEGLDRAKIKVITADDVTDYDIKENGSSITVYSNKIVTEKYLSDNHYVIETDLAGYMPKISNPFGGIIVESTSEGTVVETGYNITELNNRIDTAYQTGYSAREEVASKMNQFSSAPAGAGYIVITNGSSQDSVGVADIKAENILTGYSNHDGFIAVWDKEHGNHIADAGIAASNVATNEFVGSIPQGSSATTIIDYIDEVTTPIKSIPNTPANIATFGGAAALPMPSLKVGIVAQQAGTGDPSPQNIRPITGWSAINVCRTGKNILGINEMYGGETGISIEDNSATGNSLRFSAVEFNIPKNLVGKQLTLSAKVTVPNDVTSIYAQGSVNDVRIEGNRIESNTTGVTSVTFIPESTDDFCRITYGSGNGVITVSDFQLEIGSATAYEPYNGQTYTTTLKDSQGNPLECYGGELSNVNGVQTLDNAYGYAEFDGSSDENWQSYSGSRFVIALTNYIAPSSSVVSDISANYLKTVNKGSQGETLWIISGSDPNTTDIMINIGKTTVAEVREYLAENPLQVKYKLATPQTIPQDNLAIATQEGTNNLWADSGDVISGEYRAARYQDIYTYGALPSVMSSDNGKLLQVVNGTWQAVDLDANSTSY